MLDSLNPFEFRAGIYFMMGLSYVVKNVVLIPLNSGLVFTSGLSWIYSTGWSLNPFEFRAGIYLNTSWM